MITPRLKGGLGNQMFQIAAAYAAAKDHDTEMAIDLSITHTSGQGHPHKKYDDNLYKNIPRFEFKGTEFEVYNEPKFSYSKIPAPPDNKHLIIDGYFQSPKYFKKYEPDIRKLFNIPDDIKQGVREKVEKIKEHFNKPATCCVHVRRGEYLKLPNIHPVQTVDFFKRSMALFDTDNTVFIIISDDMKWCMENIKFHTVAYCNSGYDYDTQPVDNDLNELFDMYLAAHCDGNIISNSSFGWWGAWFNVCERVVAPATWFGPDGPPDYQDIYCNNWRIM
jgi:hypothetical protein